MKLFNKNEKFTGRIKLDQYAGYYLYIYDNVTQNCIEDHLQDTLDDAKAQAEEDFGLDINSWVEIEEEK